MHAMRRRRTALSGPRRKTRREPIAPLKGVRVEICLDRRMRVVALKMVLAVCGSALLLAAVFVPDLACAQGGGVNVPGFWDPKRRPERPDVSRLPSIRFMTEEDYPPFNF